MALKGVLRPGLIQLRVTDFEKTVEHYVERIGLDEVSREDDKVYLKAWDEFDHHSVVLRKADHAGMDFFAFKVDSEETLADFRKKIEEYGLEVWDVPAGEQPGFGPRIAFMIASGHRIELYAQVELAEEHPPITNPEIVPRELRGMKAIRFDHGLLYGPNIQEVKKFFTEVLDFSVAEQVDKEDPEEQMAIWMTCSNKAHDIAFVEYPEPGKFHHIAFMLESWYDIGNAADIMARYDISIDVGPTRHGITRGQTIYFFDPSGNRCEVYAGGYQHYPDNPVRNWTPDQIGKGIFYYERKLNEAFLSVVT